MERLCIYPKDVQIVTGRTERYGRKLLKRIQKALYKDTHQFITIDEFCKYTGLTIGDVQKQIRY